LYCIISTKELLMRKYSKNKTVFSIRLNNAEEVEMIEELRKSHSINISNSFKVYLKLLLENLKEIDNNEFVRKSIR
jgi:hypothetical protein